MPTAEVVLEALRTFRRLAWRATRFLQFVDLLLKPFSNSIARTRVRASATENRSGCGATTNCASYRTPSWGRNLETKQVHVS